MILICWLDSKGKGLAHNAGKLEEEQIRTTMIRKPVSSGKVNNNKKKEVRELYTEY